MTDETDKDAYEKRARAQLEEWRAEIEKLKAQADKAEADARIHYQQKLEELKAHRDQMQAQLEQYQKSGQDAFWDMKKGLDKSWSEMESAMRQAWSRFG
ncbi:hypothetical protein P1J78_12815 [Psychromarinibacter sp. C21-152]|uniref:Uncharacterized protein n=1 Tax=Psychromarinibacter sediminicola TaxID=3033385 RepID=A0AAE3NTZ2_9RHOB|nr:hypothetical protein [Psychromarinibacter sediminicola]MDF0601619.1 hypothetical protein [Psychromarinibacter sediminicola]